MTKARVILDTACPRRCTYCCNTPEMLRTAVPLRTWELILGADEIMLTGGEPMFRPGPGVIYGLSQHLKLKLGFKGKLYVYTALWTEQWPDTWACLDGLHYTLHARATEQDAEMLLNVQADARKWHFKPRLSIIPPVNLSINLDLTAWSSIKMEGWRDNCPLPAGETLYIWRGDCYYDRC